MKNTTIKIILSFLIIIKTLLMIFLIWGEVQGLIYNSVYKFHYLLIINVIFPALIISGVFEYFALKKVLHRYSVIMTFPFLIACGFAMAMQLEGSYNPNKLSYFLISIECLAIILFGYTFVKIIKANNPDEITNET